MPILNLGKIIQQNRKRYELTQEELAHKMGVSKSSVSKWESGQTYPDIFLLPELATFFNLSVDELLNYQPQLTKEKIREYYLRFSAEFVALDFNNVLADCQSIINKYYACLPFLLQMATLLLNHVSLAATREDKEKLLEDILRLVRRVKRESSETPEINQANVLEAFILLQKGEYELVINNLGQTVQPFLAENQLLAGAYAGLQQFAESQKILQVSTYQSVLELISTNGKLLGFYQEDLAKFEEISKRTGGIIDLYQVEHLHPYIALTYYLEECLGHASQGRAAAALNTLREIVRLLESKRYPFSLKGDAYFNLVDEWINSQLTLGAHLPSSEELVKSSIIAFFNQHPSFTSLFADNTEFQLLMNRLVSCLT